MGSQFGVIEVTLLKREAEIYLPLSLPITSSKRKQNQGVGNQFVEAGGDENVGFGNQLTHLGVRMIAAVRDFSGSPQQVCRRVLCDIDVVVIFLRLSH